jgi:Putative restriction endonuclease
MSDMAIQYKLREFTVEEYHRMAEVGVLRAEELVELLDGAIVEMSPIGTRHWGRHLDVVEYLIRTLGETAKIAGQSSLSLGTRDEPQPDIAVLAPRRYQPSNPPSPSEIYAVIELSETSLLKDSGPKLLLYARHAIADYLVVDLAADVLLHHHEPHDFGYHACDRLAENDTFELGALPGIRLRADAFLACGI